MPTDTLSPAAAEPLEDPPSLAPVAGSLRKRDAVALLGLVALVGLIAWLVIPSRVSKLQLPGNASASQTSRFAGLTLSPAEPAPPLSLSSYQGQRVNLGDYRGHPVLVTFLYTHCVDVCPLITASLHNAVVRLPARAASRLRIIAVSVDPRGDTRVSVAAFLRAHAMIGRMSYLVGSSRDLGRVWGDWNVASQRETANPELVAHSALVYGVSASGKLMTVYRANFDPAEIVHDVAGLAGS